MVIPDGPDFHAAYETFTEQIGTREIIVIVEEPVPPFEHIPSVNDVFAMVKMVPEADRDGLDMYVLKGETRKRKMLNCCWGRMIYEVSIDDYTGGAVFLYANDLQPFRVDKSVTPDGAKKLERYEIDGHRIRTEKRHHIVEPTRESVRAGLLYRTLLHEVGHWRQFLERVDLDGISEEERTRLWELFCTMPVKDKEDYADRYADTLRSKLLKQGLIPFPQA